MEKTDKYRAHAARALSLAEVSASAESKKLLLKVAQSWLELAEAQAKEQDQEPKSRSAPLQSRDIPHNKQN
jgi:hypothetical protein